MLQRAVAKCAPALKSASNPVLKRGFATQIPPFHLAIPVRDLDEGAVAVG